VNGEHDLSRYRPCLDPQRSELGKGHLMTPNEFTETSDGVDVGGAFAFLDGHRVAAGLGDLIASGAFWWVTTAVAATLIAVFVLHRHFRSHHLRSRVRFDLLPTATFDPSPQAVLAFAHQLGRARPVHGWVPRSVVGVRIRFSTDPEFGKMVMSVEGRESVTGVLNKLVYPDVAIRRTGGQNM
jgi:hypothetical protein